MTEFGGMGRSLLAAAAGLGMALAAGGALAQTAAWSPNPLPPGAPAPVTVLRGPVQTAQGAAPQPIGGIVDEVKLGALVHDAKFLGGRESGADINAEILFTSPSFLKIILAPRLHVGGSFNTARQTNQAYAGLTWTWALFRQLAKPDDALLFGFSFGPGYNDGKTFTRDPKRKSLGWQVMFRESVEIGYQVTPHTDVSAFVDHISNGGIAKANQSINDVGMRVGYKF